MQHYKLKQVIVVGEQMWWLLWEHHGGLRTGNAGTELSTNGTVRQRSSASEQNRKFVLAREKQHKVRQCKL